MGVQKQSLALPIPRPGGTDNAIYVQNIPNTRQKRTSSHALMSNKVRKHVWHIKSDYCRVSGAKFRVLDPNRG